MKRTVLFVTILTVYFNWNI